MRRLTTVLVALFALLLIPKGVSATTPLISIPINTIVSGDVGSSHELKSVNVASEDVGSVCSVVVTAQNQQSVHPGNNLVVSSGSTNVTLVDVERASNVTTVANGQLTLGNNVAVTLVLGQDKIFSGGMDVELTCEKPPADIEVCRDGLVITIKEDERLETDTNPPCPPVEIEVCRDGVVITINEDERLETDTEVPCPPVEIEVCRDGVVITINEDERLETDTSVPCPTPDEPLIKVCRDGRVITIREDEKLSTDTSAPCKVLGTVKELPNTGASIASLMIGTGGISSFAYSLVTRKRLY